MLISIYIYIWLFAIPWLCLCVRVHAFALFLAFSPVNSMAQMSSGAKDYRVCTDSCPRGTWSVLMPRRQDIEEGHTVILVMGRRAFVTL